NRLAQPAVLELKVLQALDAENIIASLLAAAAAGTISDVTTARAWTGAEFKAIADKGSKAQKAYRGPGKEELLSGQRGRFICELIFWRFSQRTARRGPRAQCKLKRPVANTSALARMTWQTRCRYRRSSLFLPRRTHVIARLANGAQRAAVLRRE